MPLQQRDMVFGTMAPPQVLKQQSLRFKKRPTQEFNIQENEEGVLGRRPNVCLFHPTARSRSAQPDKSNDSKSRSKSRGSKATKSSRKSGRSEETEFNALGLQDKERHLYILKQNLQV